MYSHNQGHPLQSQQGQGQGHTPALQQSFGTGAPMKPVSAIWTDGKFREDYDACKGRINDSSKFNIRGYPDPLLPRQQQSQAEFYPKGVTADLEAHLKGVIAQVKGSSS